MLKQEGYEFMGGAFEVYNELGFGMAEEVYQQSLEIELSLRQIDYASKAELEIYYKGNRLNTRYRPDLLVYSEIVVELKAAKELLPEHYAQLANYMRIASKRVGYLVNFGSRSGLEWKRFVIDSLPLDCLGPTKAAGPEERADQTDDLK